jgi:Flp pilus assembly protein TadG
MRVTRSGQIPGCRRSTILPQVILVLTALLGMTGLVVDGGLMMTARRAAQNAADSAAMAAAFELKRGNTVANSKTAATTFVQTYNSLSAATVTTNIPPSTGPHSTGPNAAHYAEVIVSYPVSTLFMGILGITSNNVQARAVAGYEPLTLGEGAIVLDPTAQPGLTIQGGASLVVDGSVVVNSEGPGLDQYGSNVNPFNISGQPAMAAGNNATIKLQYLQVDGGVDASTLASVQAYSTGGPFPLFAGQGTIEPDPLASIPAPLPSNTPSIPATAWSTLNPNPTTSGGITTYPSGVYTNSISLGTGTTTVLNPGIYADIKITGSANVTFNPGVYIMAPQSNNQGLTINGSGTVTGGTATNGIMFYFTGDDYYNSATPSLSGAYDAADSVMRQTTPSFSNAPSNSNLPTVGGVTESSNVRWSSMTINASGPVNFYPLADTNTPANFTGILFYQRPRNTTAASIQGGGSSNNVSLNGTIYARWAQFKMAGGGRYNAQFIVGSFNISGQATLTINGNGKNLGLANEVFLVE